MIGTCVFVAATPTTRSWERPDEGGWTLCACPDAATAERLVAAIQERRDVLRATRARAGARQQAWLDGHPPAALPERLPKSAHRRAERDAWRAA